MQRQPTFKHDSTRDVGFIRKRTFSDRYKVVSEQVSILQNAKNKLEYRQLYKPAR